MKGKTMSTKKMVLSIAVATVIGLVLWVPTSHAAKLALTDTELDGITAAGEPTVITSGDNSSVTFEDTGIYTLSFDVPDAQSGIRALTIQNVVGEQQLLINLNVLSAVNDVAGTDQRNFSLQSWGATNPNADTVKVVNGVWAAAAPCSGDKGCTQTATAGNAVAVGLTGPGGAGGKGGDGGAGGTGANNPGGPGAVGTPGASSGSIDSVNAISGSARNSIGNAAASTSPGSISPAASASGDLVVQTGSNSPINVKTDPMYTMDFGASNAQSDLAALFVSNVVGQSQMAFNLNIAAATLNLVPEASTSFATPFQNATGGIKQVNMGLQFRGTPLVGSTGTTGTFTLGIAAESK